VLRLATTTSTADSGLLDAIVPDFEQRHNADVQIVAVGTGQALKLGENGDADVMLVHARTREDEFVANGFGVNRQDVMYNDFVVVGPQDDPAGVAGASSAADAFAKIAASSGMFASRGDESGTFTKEQSIWAATGVTPTADLAWYKSLGQGMGETLTIANELGAYTLSDRGTFLSQRDNLPDLKILVGGDTIAQNNDKTLRNPYGVIAVNPERHQGVNAVLAEQFIEWITSAETQQHIAEFGQEQFGQPLFYPVAAGAQK
jgi:tungstate transport system substrate-binding protein